MAASVVVLIVLLLGVSVGLGLLVVYFVRQEGPTEEGLDWDSAENVARKDDPNRDGSNDREW